MLSELQRIFAGAKRPVYLVGGPVRDRLLGREFRDWDVAGVGARRLASRAARALRGRLITLDAEHEIYRVVLPAGITLDVAELQGGSIAADLRRRDFAVNAMAADLRYPDRVIDPLGGRRDLLRKRLRAISAANLRDDRLRLLRAFRLEAQLGFSLETRTLGWIKAEVLRLQRPGRGAGSAQGLGVAAERVREEMLRLLAQPRAAKTLWALDRVGLLVLLFPDLEACRGLAEDYHGRGGVLRHLLETVENLEFLLESVGREPAEGLFRFSGALKGIQHYLTGSLGGFPRAAWLKLAGLLHDIGKPATAEIIGGRMRFFGHEDVGCGLSRTLLARLRYSRQELQQVGAWVRHHMRPGNLAAAWERSKHGESGVPTEKAVARFFRDLGVDGVGMLLISLADHYCYLSRRQWGKAKDPVERTTLHLLEAYFLRRERVLPPKLIDGHRIMRTLKLRPGPAVGVLLDAVRDAQAEGKVRTLEEAIVWLKKNGPRLARTKAAAPALSRRAPNPPASKYTPAPPRKSLARHRKSGPSR
jgi:hypothetical protein